MNEAIRYPYKELEAGKYYFNRPEWCIPARVRVEKQSDGLYVHFYLRNQSISVDEVLADTEFYVRK